MHGTTDFQLWREIPTFVPTWLPWVLLTPGIGWLTLRLRPSRAGWPASLGAHFVGVVVAAGLHLMAFGWFRVTFPPGHLPEGWIPTSLMTWMQNSVWTLLPQGELLAYGVVVAGTLAVEERQHVLDENARTLRLEAQLSEARLAALQSQLRPHFLFNALNSCLVLVKEDPEAAETMLRRVGDLLRHSLAVDARTMVPLADELALAELYLGIERVRFADRLSVHVQVPTEALSLDVPAWLLQPLIENALLHGIAPRRDGGDLWITCAITGPPAPTLSIDIEDNGAGIESHGATGLGLSNTRARLHAAYGVKATLALGARVGGGGTCLSISIPIDANGEAKSG